MAFPYLGSALILLTMIPTATAVAADSVKTWTPTAQTKKTEATKTKNDTTLWNAWFTVTVNKVIRYQYYNERVELRKGRLFIQNHAWKLEEDFLNEEQLGVYVENSPELTPLFYNYHSTYRSTETSIDGTVSDKRTLSVRIRKNNKELPVLKKTLSAKTIFSEAFAVWIRFNLPTLRESQALSFSAIDESNLELNFLPISCKVKLEKPDTFATQTKTSKLHVDYNGQQSWWWVDAGGVPVRIEYPETQTIVERVTEEKARKFLE